MSQTETQLTEIEEITPEQFEATEDALTKRFEKILFHSSVLEKKIPIKTILDKKNIHYTVVELDQLRDNIEIKIMACVEASAIAQYLYMQKEGVWTDAGIDRVKLSFMRLLLDIPVDQEISFQDYSRFESIIEQKAHVYQLDTLDDIQLKFLVLFPKFYILGRTIEYTDATVLNRILEIVGSCRRLMIGEAGIYKSMIFGQSRSVQFEKYNVHIFHKEEMRTPNMVHYIVAVIQEEEIGIRREVCQYVFHNKWITMFDQDMFSLEILTTDDVSSISQGIKEKTIKAFGVDSRETFAEKETMFLDEMTENLVFHELAHDVMEEGSMTKSEELMVGGLSSVSETILSIMTEVLTEWTPRRQNVSGPIRNIVDTAMLRGNKEKATRMTLIYMSDAWFLDTDTEFMYPYNDIMFTLFMKYIDNEGQIDFVSMHSDLENIFSVLMEMFRDVVADLYVQVKSLSFTESGKFVSFEQFDKDVRGVMALVDKPAQFKEQTEIGKEGNYWLNFFQQLKRRAPDRLEQLLDFLKTKEGLIYQQISKQFLDSNAQKQYGADLRSYVISRMKESGFHSSHEQSF